MTDERDTVFAETIARHFPGANVAGAEVDLAFGDLHLSCSVHEVRDIGSHKSASLFFQLSGGCVGPAPVFASVSGYGDDERQAIITGACNWACTFGPVLRAGLGGEEQPDVERFEATVDGQRYRVFVDGLDRGMSTGDAAPDDADVGARLRAARTRLGGWPWLTRPVVESGRLPMLSPDRPTVLSIFVFNAPGGLTVEVKVNGCDWPGMDQAFASAAPQPAGRGALLRELAVLVPLSEPVPLARGPLARTLAGLLVPLENGVRDAARWPGWRRHGGELQEPLGEMTVARLERDVGPLPSDYRSFLVEVAAAGAGPGYGLLSPMGAAQRALARGTFQWRDGDSRADPPSGVLALAHAGCGIMWLLVLHGPARGEVWSDAGGSDGKVRREAGSFSGWYRSWLEGAVRGDPRWCSWDGMSCATASVLVQLLEAEKDAPGADAAGGRLAGRVGPGGIALASGGGSYFPPGAALDPCHCCVAHCEYQGLADVVFATGTPPLQGSDGPPEGPRGGFLGRWARKLGWEPR